VMKWEKTRRKADSENDRRISLATLEQDVHLRVLGKDPEYMDLRTDVKAVVLYADQKRRELEDDRAWHRNKTEWWYLPVMIGITIVLPIAVAGHSADAWFASLMGCLSPVPQFAFLAVRTIKRW
jgi:Flp pilus assembly protein TadB